MPTRFGVVCLSGGMDSFVAFVAAKKTYPEIEWSALHFDYGQRSAMMECPAALTLWEEVGGSPHDFHVVSLPMMTRAPSILAGSQANVAEYANPEHAKLGTATDLSYIPLRNALMVTNAAAWLLSRSPEGGVIAVGIRQRTDGPGGFPDCTRAFAVAMGQSLSIASGAHIIVHDPLNGQPMTVPHLSGRANTILWAKKLGVADALKHSVSCYHGTRCGKCLPCVRRAQAYKELGAKDPADAS